MVERQHQRPDQRRQHDLHAVQQQARRHLLHREHVKEAVHQLGPVRLIERPLLHTRQPPRQIRRQPQEDPTLDHLHHPHLHRTQRRRQPQARQQHQRQEHQRLKHHPERHRVHHHLHHHRRRQVQEPHTRRKDQHHPDVLTLRLDQPPQTLQRLVIIPSTLPVARLLDARRHLQRSQRATRHHQPRPRRIQRARPQHRRQLRQPHPLLAGHRPRQIQREAPAVRPRDDQPPAAPRLTHQRALRSQKAARLADRALHPIGLHAHRLTRPLQTGQSCPGTPRRKGGATHRLHILHRLLQKLHQTLNDALWRGLQVSRHPLRSPVNCLKIAQVFKRQPPRG